MKIRLVVNQEFTLNKIVLLEEVQQKSATDTSEDMKCVQEGLIYRILCKECHRLYEANF